LSNYPHPAVRVVTRFDGRPSYVELPGSPDPEVQQIGELGARRKALEQELRELEKTIKELQAAREEASDTNVVEDFLQGIGVQDDPVDDIQAAIARASQRMKEIQEELQAISDEMQALLAELQAREKEHQEALEREVGDASEIGDAAGAEPVRTTVSDAVGPYAAFTVEVSVFPPPPASRARGPLSDAQPHSDVDHNR
jgi:ABC-type transporter Mla subunit MlaD